MLRLKIFLGNFGRWEGANTENLGILPLGLLARDYGIGFIQNIFLKFFSVKGGIIGFFVSFFYAPLTHPPVTFDLANAPHTFNTPLDRATQT